MQAPLFIGSSPSANPRRLEPELHSVLRSEGLPTVNVPPVMKWREPPSDPATATRKPLTTQQLIPYKVESKLRAFRVQVRACFEAAKRGRWRWARDHRPDPLHMTHEECLMPIGRSCSWVQSREDGLWRPLTTSSWPGSPPDGELETALIVEEAITMGFPDMEIISHIAHGYPAPELSRETVLGPPHVGALKHPEAFEKCSRKDRDRGWVRWGSELPEVWPMRADPMNVVLRHGKPRMTIDKTMRLVEGVVSYNESVDLEGMAGIVHVRVT